MSPVLPQLFDIAAIRAQFPVFEQTVHGRPLTYLDSAATTHKPEAVLDALAAHYSRDNANIHRAVYQLGERATAAYEGARADVARFLGVADPAEIIFTRGATEALNLVAHSFLRPRLRPGDVVLVGALEHHANLVPWQLVGARTVPIPVDERGDLRLDAYQALLEREPVALVAIGAISNAIGTVNPLPEIIAAAKARDLPVVVDGAQAVPHQPVDLSALGADFYAFSGHKLYAPTGIGVLWGKAGHLRAMPPYQGGGDMIETVAYTGSTFADIPARFEAGTPHIAGAVGLGAACRWLEAIGMAAIEAHEARLTEALVQALSGLPQVRLIGTPRRRAGAVSFLVDGLHPHDLGTLLDRYGVCVRVGHHCAQPAMACFGVDATVRASVGVYNHAEDIQILADSLRRIIERFT